MSTVAIIIIPLKNARFSIKHRGVMAGHDVVTAKRCPERNNVIFLVFNYRDLSLREH